jgi:hypothetical protein
MMIEQKKLKEDGKKKMFLGVSSFLCSTTFLTACSLLLLCSKLEENQFEWQFSELLFPGLN